MGVAAAEPITKVQGNVGMCMHEVHTAVNFITLQDTVVALLKR